MPNITKKITLLITLLSIALKSISQEVIIHNFPHNEQQIYKKWILKKTMSSNAIKTKLKCGVHYDFDPERILTEDSLDDDNGYTEISNYNSDVWDDSDAFNEYYKYMWNTYSKVEPKLKDILDSNTFNAYYKDRWHIRLWDRYKEKPTLKEILDFEIVPDKYKINIFTVNEYKKAKYVSSIPNLSKISSVCFNQSGNLLATASLFGIVHIFDVSISTQPKKIATFFHPKAVTKICFDRLQDILIAKCEDGKTRIFMQEENGIITKLLRKINSLFKNYKIQ